MFTSRRCDLLCFFDMEVFVVDQSRAEQAKLPVADTSVAVQRSITENDASY